MKTIFSYTKVIVGKCAFVDWLAANELKILN